MPGEIQDNQEESQPYRWACASLWLSRLGVLVFLLGLGAYLGGWATRAGVGMTMSFMTPGMVVVIAGVLAVVLGLRRHGKRGVRARERGQLMREEGKYRALFERSADPILIIDRGVFVDCNEATVRILRATSKSEVLETHPSELSPPFQPDGRPSFEKANEMISMAFERGSHRFEWNHKRADGEVFPVEVLLTAVQERDRRVLHVVWALLCAGVCVLLALALFAMPAARGARLLMSSRVRAFLAAAPVPPPSHDGDA